VEGYEKHLPGCDPVRSKTLTMIGIAIVFGLAAVFMAQKWLDRQSSRLRQAQVVPAPVSVATIVVAAAPLRFGTEISPQHLREVPWPQGAIPKGAFSSVKEILDGQTRRTALIAMEENEPLLKSKITGPGQRASLAAVIDPGMKALTVRVNDVNGVAGFVLPGERVDVLLTRNLDKEDSWADVLLQNVKVLAADQSADDRTDKPSVVKAVTLEVSTGQAQRLALASTLGALSLVLRPAGVVDLELTRRINVADLTHDEPKAPPAALATAPPSGVISPRTTTVSVARAMKRQEYSVPVQASDAPNGPDARPAARVTQSF
jgi:pilus assembly protein CpaB